MTTDSITGFRFGNTKYQEGIKYAIGSGLIDDIVGKIRDYLPPSGGTTLTPAGMSAQFKDDRVILDSSWGVSQLLPSNLQLMLNTDHVTGSIRVRIAALGTPDLVNKHPALAKNYSGIKDYAIGISFQSDLMPSMLDSSLVATYRRKKGEGYNLLGLQGIPLNQIINIKNVTAASRSGAFGDFLAGAIPGSKPTVDLPNSPFSDEFAAGWPTTNWVA